MANLVSRALRLLSLALLAMGGAMQAPATAAAQAVRTGHVEAELIPQTSAARPGAVVYVALRQKIAPGWHTYWRNPGDAGQPTSLAWTLPAGWRAGDIVWPAPERDLAGPIMNYVYSGEVLLPVPITVPAGAAAQPVVLKANASWLVCKDVCIPETAALSLSLPVAAGPAAINPRGGQAVADTVAGAPKPGGLQARFKLQGDTLALSVRGAALAGLDAGSAYFFPYDGAVLDQASPQRVSRGPDGLTLTLPAGYGPSHGKPPSQLQGVLSLGGKTFELDAALGEPFPQTAGTAVAPTAAAGSSTGAAVPAASDAIPPATGASGMGLAGALALALLGGLVLNLMPCVFPVLSMKAAALARHLETPERARGEGIAFLVGVVGSFLVLAGLLIAARSAGQAVGWGFQLQAPGVVAALVLVMLGAGLNLSGVFEVGFSLQGVGAEAAAQRGGLAGAALTGALAVVTAAPCTAPFMAPAIGWALAQPPATALLVFLGLGLGLALPFTLLSFAPAVFRKLPRPGPWMETLRRLLAFPMYGAAAWLAWVFALQAGAGDLPWLFAAALAASFAAFCWGLAQRQGGAAAVSRGAAGLAIVGAVAAVVVSAQQAAAGGAPPEATASGGPAAIEPWSPAKLASLRAARRPVFVDFTAAWCVTCQVNERTALAMPQVAAAFQRDNAAYLKADWTRPNAEIANALSAAGRSGVPLYLVYPAGGGAPVILPQLLSGGAVVRALDAARG